MNKEEAHKVLEAGGWLTCAGEYYLYFNNHESICSDTLDYRNGTSEFDCCQNNYKDIEETLQAIEDHCNGNWEDVS